MAYGTLVVQAGSNTYPGGDGGCPPVADLQAADAVLPSESGLTDQEVRFLYDRRVAGRTWAQAKADLLANGQPTKLHPTDAVMEAWKAEIERRVAVAPYYPL